MSSRRKGRAPSRRTFFDRQSEPLGARIAAGLHKIGLALRHQAWQAAGGGGIRPTQGQILVALAAGAELRPTAIAERLAVSLPTVSDSVRVLVDKGLVVKVPDRDDARATRLRLTPAGRREAAGASSWPDFLVAAVDSMSGPEQEAFLAALVKMIHALQVRGQIPVSRMCTSCRFFRPYEHDDGKRPHHCAYVDAPLGPGHLRLDCAEHEPADPALAEANCARFATRPPHP